jgi:hypothetical protein
MEDQMLRRDLSKVLLASAAGTALLTRNVQAQSCTPPCYPQTSRESAAGVTPTDTQFPPGDVRRYGAVGDDSTPSHAAFSQAVSSNDFVYVPPGKYVFNSTVTVNRSGISIWAPGPCMTAGGLAVNGTSIRLTSSAGSDGAVFDWTVKAEAVHIHGIAFLLKSPGGTYPKGHRGLRFYELLSSTITNCRFEGVGNSSDDAHAIEFLGEGTYTGAVDVSQNYFTNVRYGVILRKNCTTVRICNNEFYGNNTFSGTYYSLVGVYCENLCIGTTISENVFQGWATGLRHYGVGLTQIGNYFEDNQTSWEWTRGAGVTQMLHTAIGDRIVSGGSPSIPSNNVDGCIMIRTYNVLFDKAYVEAGLGFRSTVSDWSVPPLKLGNYSLWIDGSGKLRIKNGAPSSATDGTIVGTQS